MAHKIVNERALAEARCPDKYAVNTEVSNAALWLSSWQRRVVSCFQHAMHCKNWERLHLIISEKTRHLLPHTNRLNRPMVRTPIQADMCTVRQVFFHMSQQDNL